MSFKRMHTCLLVSRFKECFRFYRDVMGLQVLSGDEESGRADFRAGGNELALLKRDWLGDVADVAKEPAHAVCPDAIALVFEVESVDDTYERLRARNVPFLAEPMDRPEWGVRTAHLRDSDGNLIELNQRLS